MVCELKIRQLEKELGRKLTEKEKNKIKEEMHHSEIEFENKDKEELEVIA